MLHGFEGGIGRTLPCVLWSHLLLADIGVELEDIIGTSLGFRVGRRRSRCAVALVRFEFAHCRRSTQSQSRVWTARLKLQSFFLLCPPIRAYQLIEALA